MNGVQRVSPTFDNLFVTIIYFHKKCEQAVNLNLMNWCTLIT